MLTTILADARSSGELGRTWTKARQPSNTGHSLTGVTMDESLTDQTGTLHMKTVRAKENAAAVKADTRKSAHSQKPRFSQTSLSASDKLSSKMDGYSSHTMPPTSASKGARKRQPKLEKLEVHSFESGNGVRPTTPVGVSEVEPCFSKVGRSVSAPCEAGEGVRGVSVLCEARDGVKSVTEMEVLSESAVESRKQLAVAEEK